MPCCKPRRGFVRSAAQILKDRPTPVPSRNRLLEVARQFLCVAEPLLGLFYCSLLVLTPALPIYAIAHGWRGYAVAVMLLVSALTGALVNVILSMISATLLDRFGRVLVSTLQGRIVLAVVCGVAAVCGLMTHPGFWAAVLLLFLMVRQEFQKWHYQTAWA